jgi:hypothetical protein
MGGPLRYPTFASDSWELNPGEAQHIETPQTFRIPALKRRQNIKRGQLVKLIFELEKRDAAVDVERDVERMWVLVTEQIGNQYLGTLNNVPFSIEPNEGTYLVLGAEIPFGPEHVINIQGEVSTGGASGRL